MAAVLVRMDKDDLGRVGRAVHQANKMWEDSTLGELNSKMEDAIASGREGSITTAGMAQDPPKSGQVGGNVLDGNPAWTAGHPNRENGFLDGPSIHKPSTGRRPGNPSLEALEGDEVLLLLKELEPEELRGRNHEYIRHRSWLDPEVLKHKVVPLLT